MDENTLARFWSKVDKNGPIQAHCPDIGPCWVWTAGHYSAGYGAFRLNGRHEKAHRVAFLLTHGRWPEPQGLHHCDNRSCCNPRHIYEGAHEDNMRDMRMRARACMGDDHWQRKFPERRLTGNRNPMRLRPELVLRGEAHGRAKLRDEDVMAIRKEYACKRTPYPALAKRYGVCANMIGMIVRRESWTHIA